MGKRLLTEDDRVEILQEVDSQKQDKLVVDEDVYPKSTNPVQSMAVYKYCDWVIGHCNDAALHIHDVLKASKQDKLSEEQINNINNIPNIKSDIEDKQDKAFVFDVDTAHLYGTDIHREDIVGALNDGKQVIARVTYQGAVYLAPLQKIDDTRCEFDIFTDNEHLTLINAINDVGDEWWQVNTTDVITYTELDNALNTRLEHKVDKPKNESLAKVQITLADNTEYKGQNISNLEIDYPEGNFICSLTFTTASSGDVIIKLPDSSKFIGEALIFKNGETWELNIKNGIVVGGVVK